VVLEAADHFARRARRGADVGPAPAGCNTAEPDHAALPDDREARRALGAHPTPTRRVLDDIGQTGKNIRVRAALTVEVGGLSSIVLRADGYASAVDRAGGCAFHDKGRGMRAGGCDRGIASGGLGLTCGLSLQAWDDRHRGRGDCVVGCEPVAGIDLLRRLSRLNDHFHRRMSARRVTAAFPEVGICGAKYGSVAFADQGSHCREHVVSARGDSFDRIRELAGHYLSRVGGTSGGAYRVDELRSGTTGRRKAGAPRNAS